MAVFLNYRLAILSGCALSGFPLENFSVAVYGDIVPSLWVGRWSH